MRHWFQDGVFRTVFRNAGYLLSGKIAAAALGVIALSCVGRGLGPAMFGTLTLIHAYAVGAAALTRFQSWQVVIRYGAPALARDEHQPVRDSIRLACGLDLASGVAGMAVAMAVLPWLAPRFGVAREWLPLAIAYCTLIPTMSAATPTGVLRLYGRFDLTAWEQMVTPGLRAAGTAAAFFAGAGFSAYVAVWYVADVGGDLVNWGFAIRELRRRGRLGDLRPGLFGTARRLPDAWSFVWTTNIAISLNAAWNSITSLVVGGILGPVSAGLFRIAMTVVDGAGKPADMLTKGFYPEIMRLDPATKRPWRLAARAAVLAGGPGLFAMAVLLVGGKPLIAAIFGARYLPAYGLLMLMMLALAVEMASFPLQSLLYMVHRQRAALAAQGAAVIAYLATLAFCTWRFGLTGAGIAYMLGNLLQALFMLAPVVQSYRRRGVAAAPAPPLPA